MNQPYKSKVSATPNDRIKFRGRIAAFLVSLTILSTTMQLICVTSAILGGRENRLHLTGAFALAPVSISLGIISIATVKMLPTRFQKPTVALLASLIGAQLVLFLFG